MKGIINLGPIFSEEGYSEVHCEDTSQLGRCGLTSELIFRTVPRLEAFISPQQFQLSKDPFRGCVF